MVPAWSSQDVQPCPTLPLPEPQWEMAEIKGICLGPQAQESFASKEPLT